MKIRLFYKVILPETFPFPSYSFVRSTFHRIPFSVFTILLNYMAKFDAIFLVETGIRIGLRKRLVLILPQRDDLHAIMTYFPRIIWVILIKKYINPAGYFPRASSTTFDKFSSSFKSSNHNISLPRS